MADGALLILGRFFNLSYGRFLFVHLLPVSGQVAQCRELASTARDWTRDLRTTMPSAPDVRRNIMAPTVWQKSHCSCKERTRSPVLFQKSWPEEALPTVCALEGENFHVNSLLVNRQVALAAEYFSTSSLPAGDLLKLVFYQPPVQHLAWIGSTGTKAQDLLLSNLCLLLTCSC